MRAMTGPTGWSVLSVRGSSFASELQAIQRYVGLASKAHRWAENPLCPLYQEPSRTRFELVRKHNLEQAYDSYFLDVEAIRARRPTVPQGFDCTSWL